MVKKYGKRRQRPDLEQTQLYDKITKLQSQILSQLQYLNKKKNHKFDCIHCYQLIPSQYNPCLNYYNQFWKSYMINIMCMKRYEEYRDWIKKINKKIKNVQNVYNERKRVIQPIQCKRRRKGSEQQGKQYECEDCGKKYKDQDSLKIHISVKHRKEQRNKNNQVKIQVRIDLIQGEQLNEEFIQNSQSEKHYYQDD